MLGGLAQDQSEQGETAHNWGMFLRQVPQTGQVRASGGSYDGQHGSQCAWTCHRQPHPVTL